ncbi:MAG: DUF4416 family protein [Thermovirgaceae bacterium]|nr:DUF4416 family protein [Thermovirgaceae bacterium]
MQPAVIRIAGILHPDKEWLEWSIDKLAEEWGRPERVSDTFPFSHTEYYSDISPVLSRTFVSFGRLARAGDLADWKVFSCSIECASGPSRRVNIDPGYVNGARLVLASTKDHAHRIYLRDGIFAEVTLRFMRKKWVPFDCTFPDFARGVYDCFLGEARKQWLRETSLLGGVWID